MKRDKIIKYVAIGLAVAAIIYLFMMQENFSVDSGCNINDIINISDADTICHNCASQCTGSQLSQCYSAGNQAYNPSPSCGTSPSGCNYDYSHDSYCGQCCSGCKKMCSTSECTDLCSDPNRGNFDFCDCSQF